MSSLEVSLGFLPGVVVLDKLAAVVAALPRDITDGDNLHARVAQEAAQQLPCSRPHADDAQPEAAAPEAWRFGRQCRGEEGRRGERLDETTTGKMRSKSHGRALLWMEEFCKRAGCPSPE